MTMRLLLAATLLASSTAAFADPPIAYVKQGGNSSELYLVNPNGSGLVKIYTNSSKKIVVSLDLKPGGGEIAFVERGLGSPSVLKVLTLGPTGAPTGPTRTLTLACAPDRVDYHPTDPVLIFSEQCSGVPHISKIRTDNSGYSVLQQGAANKWLGAPRWLNDGVSYIYVRAVAGTPGEQLCRNSCDPGSNDVVWSGSGSFGHFDVGRLSNRVLFDRGTIYISELNADTGAVLRTNFITGTDGHYSSDDTQMLYETPHAARGDYLQIYTDSSGASTRLTTKGEYVTWDWRK